MPAGIRFSEAVYDRLGHAVVGEFVDALNRVDADYRAQLEKVNEANAARFGARMDAQFAEAESRTSERFAHVDARFAELIAKADTRFAEADSRTNERFAHVDARFAQLIAKVDGRFDASREELKRELAERFEAHTRWMMGGWAIIFAALIANLFKR